MTLKNHEPLDLKCTEGAYVFLGHSHEAFWIHWFKVHMGRGGNFFCPLFVFCMSINIINILLIYTFNSKILDMNTVLNEMIISEFHLTLCISF